MTERPDIVERLIAHNSWGCGCSSDTRRLIDEAVDEIERLRMDRELFLRFWNDEQRDNWRLRGLITEWAKAEDTAWVDVMRWHAACDALHEEANR